MASFDGISRVQEFESIDRLGAGFVNWDLRANQLRGPDFRARVEVASTSDVQITRLTSSSPLLITGENPPQTAGLAFALSAPGGMRSRGRDIDVQTTAPARLPGDELHFVTQDAFDGVAVIVTHARFVQELWDRFHVDTSSLGGNWYLRTPPGTPNGQQRAHALVALQSVIASGVATSVEASRRLQDSLLQIVLEGFHADGTARLEVVPFRRQLALQVDALLRARLDQPPSLGEICRLLGAAERTIHIGFQEAFGVAPKAYLRALRLNAARRRLRSGQGPVTTVAADLGLFHFGRFAAEYKAMFGETPSETLRQAAGAAPQPEVASKTSADRPLNRDETR